jgi:hypothetical protein
VGDYVLVAIQRKSGASRLKMKWKGPRRVASLESDNVFVVEYLLKKELMTAHAARLRLYQDKELNVTAELAQAAKHMFCRPDQFSISTSKSFSASIKSRGSLTGTLSLNISASGVVSACPVKTCIGVHLFSLFDREIFRTL